MFKLSEEKVDKFIMYFSIIDILFLPYIWFISTNYSLVLLALWGILRFKYIKSMKEFKISLILSGLIVGSTALSFIYYPKVLPSGDDVWIQNLKMMLQYISYLTYYILFVYNIKKYNIKIKNILLGFFAVGVGLAIVYLVDQDLFANFKLKWNLVDSYAMWFKQGLTEQYRYNFTWTDPNNPAYAFIGVMVYLLLNVKTNIVEKLFTICATIFIVICTMSTGGMLSLILVFASISITFIISKCKKIKNVNKDENINKIKFNKKTIISIIVVVIIAILILIPFINLFSETEVFKIAIERIIGNTDDGSTSRFEGWIRVLKGSNIFKNILLGSGGRQVIIGGEKVISPHNGHLYLIYSFGFIFYTMFMYEFFRKRKGISFKEYIFVLPVFIGFTINTIVGEQKFVLLYLLLYVATAFKRTLEKSEE